MASRPSSLDGEPSGAKGNSTTTFSQPPGVGTRGAPCRVRRTTPLSIRSRSSASLAAVARVVHNAVSVVDRERAQETEIPVAGATPRSRSRLHVLAATTATRLWRRRHLVMHFGGLTLERIASEPLAVRAHRPLLLSAFSLATLTLLTSSASRADLVPDRVGYPAQTSGGAATGAQITGVTFPGGAETWNQTLWQYDLGGTDLGIPWNDGTGRTLIAFGDSNSHLRGAPVYGAIDDWRRGTFGWQAIGDTNTLQGMYLQSAHEKGLMFEGHLYPNEPPPAETNDLPTAGVSINGWDVAHYMSGANFFADGCWTVQYSDLGWRPTGSNGQFQQVINDTSFGWYAANVTWGPLSNFAQGAFVPWGGYVYLFGTPAGRTGGVKLARVDAAHAKSAGSYQYWDGATWQPNESAAIYIVPGPVAELSVQFDAPLGRFLMTYLDVSRGQQGMIVMRDSPQLEGPYGGEKIVLDALANNRAYGGFMYPIPTNGTGQSVVMNVSKWIGYNVFQYTTNLSWRDQADNLITNPGFEDGLDANASPFNHWRATGSLAVGGHTGRTALQLASNDSRRHEIRQSVTVTPGADYSLSVWTAGARVQLASFGVATDAPPVSVVGGCAGGATTTTNCDTSAGFQPGPDGHTILAQSGSFAPSAGYSSRALRFNAGSRNTVEVFVGYTGRGDAEQMLIDDVELTPLQMIRDGGFEQQGADAIGWPNATEGTAFTGIDRNRGFARSGQNDAWISTTHSGEWNAITQVIAVKPHTNYVLSGWTQTSPVFGSGYFGVRNADGSVLSEIGYGGSSPGAPYASHVVSFNSGANTSVKVYAGYWSFQQPFGIGLQTTWLRVDDVSLEPG